MTRSLLSFIVAILVVAAACANIWRFTGNVAKLPPRESDGRIIWENRLREIQQTLVAAHYRSGDVGYVAASVLKGHPRSAQDEVNWILARYVLIPLNLRQDSLDAPYVIADFSGSEPAPEIPEGFVQAYDAHNGLLLLQRQSRQ